MEVDYMTKELMLDSQDVAAYITKICARKNYFINLTKLQKLMYCVYGAVLASSDTRLCDEHPKAWQHGPVFPRVYNFTKKHPFDMIDALLNRKENVESSLNKTQIKVVNAVLEFFGKYKAGELVSWSHHPNGAWYKSTEGGIKLHQDISDELIADYFKKIIRVKNNG